MPTPLATLGLYRIGNTEYSAGRSRSVNVWHLVRKQYGDDSATFNYARFQGPTAEADYLAARDNPALAQWKSEPYSEYEYTLLLLPLSTPLPTSTASTGPVTPVATSSGGTVDMSPVVSAVNSMSAKLPGRNADGTLVIRTQDNGQPLLVMIAPGNAPPRLATDAATETTLGKIRDQLLGTLKVSFDGGVSINNLPDAFWQETQPVSLAAVPLAGNAATATLQMVGNSTLQDISTKLGAGIAVTVSGTTQVAGKVSIDGTVPVSFAFPTTQAVSGPLTNAQLREAPVPVSFNFPSVQAVSGPATNAELRASPLPVSVSGVATAALQGTSNNLLTTVANNTQGLATAAAQTTQQTALDAIKTNTTGASTAALQTTGNNSLATIATNTTGVATAAKQDAGNASLAAIASSVAAPALPSGGSTATLQTALNNLVATAAKQDAGNTSLANIATSVATAPTATQQATANGYLQQLVQNGIATSSSPAFAFTLVSALGNNPTLVRAGQTWLLGGTITNTSSSVRYFMLYNLAAAPTGTAPTTAAGGYVRTLAIPANSTVPVPCPAGRYIGFSAGLAFAAGTGPVLGTLLTGVVGGVGLTANDLVINLDYAY